MPIFTLPKVSEFGASLLARGSDVLSNDEYIINTLNTGVLNEANLDPAMEPTWTSTHTFDEAIHIPTTGLITFDGTDNFLQSITPGFLNFVFNGALMLVMSANVIDVRTDLRMDFANYIYLDNTSTMGFKRFGVNRIGHYSASRAVVMSEAVGSDTNHYILHPAGPPSESRLIFAREDNLTPVMTLRARKDSDDFTFLNSAGLVAMRMQAGQQIVLPDVATTAANSLTARSISKVWLSTTALGAINQSNGVASVAVLGTGSYRVTFSIPMLTTGYCAVVSATDVGITRIANIEARTTLRVDVHLYAGNGTSVNGAFNLVIFGRQ